MESYRLHVEGKVPLKDSRRPVDRDNNTKQDTCGISHQALGRKVFYTHPVQKYRAATMLSKGRVWKRINNTSGPRVKELLLTLYFSSFPAQHSAYAEQRSFLLC